MGRDLVVERVFKAPLPKVWRALTEAEHLARWWVPAPLTVEGMVLETRPGGRFGYVMVMEDGTRHAMEMMILDCAPHRLVFTDMMTAGFVPVAQPFMGFAAELALTRAGEGTAWRATARHAREEDARRHDGMGFQEGWGTAADQLGIYAKGLR